DLFGVESTYSPFARLPIEMTTIVIETCTVRKVSNGVELSWDIDVAKGADAVAIYRKRAGDANFQKLATLSAQQTLYIDRTAARGTLYIYVISAERGKNVLAK